MVLGSELGLISYGKAKQKLAKKMRGGLYPWRKVWQTATHGKSRATWRGRLPCIFFKNVDCVAYRHAILQDWVYRTCFLHLALPMEFSNLLIPKKCYTLRFVSKDPSHGHLKWSHLSRLVAVQPYCVLVGKGVFI